MAKELFLDYQNLKKGLQVLDDTTKAALGSARSMRNVLISDRGGIQNRPGRTLIGTKDTVSAGTVGFFNFVKSFGAQELMMKVTEEGTLKVKYPDTANEWFTLKTGFTADQDFGFKEHLVNTDNEDFVYYGNRYEPYQRWQGAVTRLSAALVGAETSVVVQTDGVLKSDILDSKTASAHSATTLDIATAAWVASQWVNMYVKITSGAQSGQIRKITANTTTQITFDSMTDPGAACTFEIRIPKFPATGSIIYNGTVIAYTAIPAHNTFTVGSAHASAATNDPVAIIPTEYPGNPRGNRLEVNLTRMVVARVRSALSRDSGGALQGSTVAGSYYVSKTKNATDFTFSASRAAGEGDIVSAPYGGDDFTDVANQEDKFYVFKPRYIESVSYTQDSNDLVSRTPVKTGVGSVGRVIKGRDDIYFMTPDKQFTSIGRVLQKDITPQTLNIGLPIKRLLDTYNFDNVAGAEYKDRLIILCRSSDTVVDNDTMLLYNKTTESFEGIWDISGYGLVVSDGNLYLAEATSNNVFQLFVGKADVEGSTTYPVSCEWLSNFFNITSSNFNQQGINGFAVEGYIRANTTIAFQLYKDLSQDAFLDFNFSGLESQFLSGESLLGFLGGMPIGLQPIGAISSPDTDGRRHFKFYVYFPYQYMNHISIGLTNTGVSQDFEVTRFGLALAEQPMYNTQQVKTI